MTSSQQYPGAGDNKNSIPVSNTVNKLDDTVLTYGTFDLFHIGHLHLLERLRELGSRLIVGVSTDEFNADKGKRTIIPFRDRARIVRAIRCVDLVIPEKFWEQKHADIRKYGVTVLGMGSDWRGAFDDLEAQCKVVYLNRTDGVSSTSLKHAMRGLDAEHVADLKESLEVVSNIVDRLQ